MAFNAYIDRLPRDVPFKMVQSFAATAAIGVFLGTAPNAILVGGGIAAVATVVEAIVRPIILSIFTNRPQIIFGTQLVMQGVVVRYLTDAAQALLGIHYKIGSCVLSVMGIVALNFYNDQSFLMRGEAMVVVL